MSSQVTPARCARIARRHSRLPAVMYVWMLGMLYHRRLFACCSWRRLASPKEVDSVDRCRLTIPDLTT